MTKFPQDEKVKTWSDDYLTRVWDKVLAMRSMGKHVDPDYVDVLRDEMKKRGLIS
jgi:hypothetical protein